jgi:cell division protein FtsZ
MAEMGKAMMGTGEAEGDRRALDAAEAAISNPLLDDVSMKGAKGVLINITGGYDMTLYEVDEAANRIRDDISSDEVNIIFGSTFDERLNGRMRVSVVATGIGGTAAIHPQSFQGLKQQPAVQPVSAAKQETVDTSFLNKPQASFSFAQAPLQSEMSHEIPQETQSFEQVATAPFGDSVITGNPQMQGQQDMQPDFHEHAFTRQQMEQPNQSPSLDARAPYQEEPQTAVAPEQPKRKPTSLFERFTSAARQKQAPSAPEPKVSKLSQEQSAPQQEADYLEIPAFLRRGGNGS